MNDEFENNGLPDELELGKLISAKLREMSTEQKKGLTEDLLKNFGPLVNRTLAATGNAGAFREALNTILGESAPIYYEITGELAPFIDKELQKPEYNGATIKDLLNQYEIKDLAHLPEDSTLLKVIEAARAAKAAAENYLPKVKYNKAIDLELILDKLNTTLYDFRTPKPSKNVAGQLSMLPVKYERDNAPEVTLFFTYSFDNELMQRLNLAESIDDEDYFYLSLIADNYIKGNDLISATKLYRDLNGSDPNATQLSKLIDRLYKLISTTIYINDREVLQAWKKPVKETYNEIVGPLAPLILHATRYTVNGRAVDGNIKITGFPIVFQTGRMIDQRTTIPKRLLAVKKADGRSVRRTPRYFRALHYLIHEIARIKNGKRTNKLIYDTFLQEMGEKTPRGKQLAIEMLFTILDHFKREGWIKGYKEETTKSTGKTGIKILFDSNKKALPHKKKRK